MNVSRLDGDEEYARVTPDKNMTEHTSSLVMRNSQERTGETLT